MEKTVSTDSGVSIHFYENRSLHSFTISLFVRGGLVYEEKGSYGFAHFFEHIAFRNIDAHMNGKLYETLDLCGLTFNAATFVDYIEFTITGAAKHFVTAAEIISRVFSPVIIPPKEILREKKRIKAEIHEEGEGSMRRFSDSVVYKGSPLSNPITGRCSDVDGFGIKKLREMSGELLRSENVFFYVAGNFRESDILFLKKTVSGLNLSIGILRKPKNIKPTEFGKRNCLFAAKKASSTTVRFSFDIDMSKCSEKEIMLLSDALFSGETCPVYREMSENTGLIYSYDNYVDFHGDFAVLSVSFDIRADKLTSAAGMLFGILSDIKNSVGKRLPFVLPGYTDNGMMALDDSETLASDNGYYNHILGLGFYSPEIKIREFTSVSGNKLSEIAENIFRCRNLVITVKGNKNGIDRDKIKALAFQKLGE